MPPSTDRLSVSSPFEKRSQNDLSGAPNSRRPQIRLIGYARVSTNEQATTARNMELRAASCDVILP